MKTLFESKIWFWLSNILTLIGIVSIVDNLQTWTNLLDWLVDYIKKKLPFIYDLVLLFSSIIHTIIEAYRSIIHPLYMWLFQWIPFHIPSTVIDILFILTMIIPPILRVKWIARNERNKEYFNEIIIEDELNNIGINLERFNTREFASIKMGLEGAVREGTKAQYDFVQKDIDFSMEKLGSNFDKALLKIEEPMKKHYDSLSIIFLKEARLILLWKIIGIALAVLISIDYIYIHYIK